MSFVVTTQTTKKLQEKHGVTLDEIRQCFASRTGKYLIDAREDHKTDPPTMWFVAETDYGRLLKVVFIQKGADIVIKTAYPANIEEIRIYGKYS